MAPIETAVAVTHLLFAGLWTGSVIFLAVAVLPLATRGDLNAAPLASIADSTTTISRLSALLLFLTGGHLAGTRYTVDSLTGSFGGYLVLAMLALWLVLAALVEIGASRLSDGTDQDKVREPARAARRPLQLAALVAALLLIDGGLLTTIA
jgi:hypothetical protein